MMLIGTHSDLLSSCKEFRLRRKFCHWTSSSSLHRSDGKGGRHIWCCSLFERVLHWTLCKYNSDLGLWKTKSARSNSEEEVDGISECAYLVEVLVTNDEIYRRMLSLFNHVTDVCHKAKMHSSGRSRLMELIMLGKLCVIRIVIWGC